MYYPHSADVRARRSRLWAQTLGRISWCVLDTETTGLGADAEVVQVAVVDGHDGRLLLDRDVRPMRATPDTDALAVHGLDLRRLAAAPSWPDVYAELHPLLVGRLVVAYNAEFDRRLLTQTCSLFGIPAPQLTWDCAMTRYTDWGGSWRSLHSACAVEDIAPRTDDPHSAAEDARLTWRLIRLMAEVDVLRSGNVPRVSHRKGG